MSLQFSVDDELIQPLVSLSYLSSDDEMEVDCPLSQTEMDPDDDSDIEVIVSMEAPVSIPKRLGGRGMTLDISSCAESESHSNTLVVRAATLVQSPITS